MRIRTLLYGLLLLGLTGVVHAQNRLEDAPGYVDLRTFEAWFDASPTLEVSIKGPLLRLVAEASRYEDPDLAEMLAGLRAIQVRGFPLRRSEFDDVARRASEMADRLEAEGWDTVIRVRKDDEQVDMHVKVHDGEIAGMVVMVVQPGYDETVFLNIVGAIDPEQIGRLGRKFNIGRLQDW